MEITQAINKNALIMAVISFLIGTILFLSFLLFKWDPLLGFGLMYVYISVFVNSIMLLVILVNALTHLKNYKENILTILLFILNIPIAIGYFLIIINYP